MEVEVGREVRASELSDTVDGRVVEVVDDGDPEATLEKLEHGMGPDET